MTRTYTTMLVSCIVLLFTVSGIVAAQETATASAPTETTAAAVPATTSRSSNETTYYGGVAGDHAVRVVSAGYIDGTAVFILESDLPRTITVTVLIGPTSTGVAAGNLVRRPIPPGRTMIRVDSPRPWVTLVTSYFVEDGRYTEIRFDDGGSALVAGPFTGTDVRDAAIGGALGALFGALLIIVRRRPGLHRDMERIAWATTPRA